MTHTHTHWTVVFLKPQNEEMLLSLSHLANASTQNKNCSVMIWHQQDCYDKRPLLTCSPVWHWYVYHLELILSSLPCHKLHEWSANEHSCASQQKQRYVSHIHIIKSTHTGHASSNSVPETGVLLNSTKFFLQTSKARSILRKCICTSRSSHTSKAMPNTSWKSSPS